MKNAIYWTLAAAALWLLASICEGSLLIAFVGCFAIAATGKTISEWGAYFNHKVSGY